MNKYLSRISENRPAVEPTKLTKPSFVVSEGTPSHSLTKLTKPPSEGVLYATAMAALRAKSPAYVEEGRWQRAIADAEAFLSQWGEQAQALGWTNADLFGLHTPPENPRPTYQRLSRYDCTGLIWLLEGRTVVALTADSAAIQTASGHVLTYRKQNKPALGPVGDSLEDFIS